MISKKVISYFSFGVFLLIVGVILMILKKPQANSVMTIGLVFELFAVLLFIWDKIKK